MPFLGAPSKYLILDSNITGGSPNLIVNGGVNNMALGNFVLTTHETGDNNIAIGNGALTDDKFGFNNVAVGFNAKRSRGEFGSSNNESVFIGNNAAGLEYANFSKSVIIGSNAGQVLAGELNNDDVYIGFNCGASDALLNNTSSRNVVIGSSAALNVDNTPSENVIIGANAANNSLIQSNNIIIGSESVLTGFGNVLENIVIGAKAGQNFDGSGMLEGDFRDNLLIGKFAGIIVNSASQTDVTRQQQTIIGNISGAGIKTGDPNTVLGYNSFSTYLEGGFDTRTTSSNFNTVIGSNNLTSRYELSIDENSISANDNIIIGDNNYFNVAPTAGLDLFLNNNIVIGRNNDPASPNLVTANKIIIGANYTIANDESYQIIIGDSTVNYDSIIIGGVDLLAGGGGLAAQATQSDLNDVSIISSAEDGISAFLAGYEFVSNTDNSTVATTNISFYAAGDNGSATTSGIYDESGTLEFNHELINGANTSSYTSALGVGNAEISIQAFDATTQGEVSIDASLNAGSFAASIFDGTDTAAIGISAIISSTSLVYEVVAPAGYKHVWNVPDETGASAADFTIANAPAAIQITNWIKLTLNGVDGYVPFLSTPI